MSLRGLSTLNFWADDVGDAVGWYTRFLGVEPYFERSGSDGRPAYVEFRIGDYQHELGIVDRRYAPPGTPDGAGGALMYWHVDDLDATVARLSRWAPRSTSRSRCEATPASSPPRWSTRSATCSA